MSFSSDIKTELCDLHGLSAGQSAAMLFGIFYASRTEESGAPLVQTESVELIGACAELVRAVFSGVRFEIVRLVKNSGSLYTLKIKSGRERIFERFGDLNEITAEAVPGGDECSSAFLRGVFVCCGSVTDPNKEYHLELVLPESARSETLLNFISEHGMSMKLTHRGRSKRTVIYAKESELIEDFLTYIGAGNHSMEIMQVKIMKDFRNRVNRSVNCESANLDKTVAAANRCADDIRLIFSTHGEVKLSPELRLTAKLRLEHQELSLSELCGLFPEPITRSGLNHRLKKLEKIAEEIREKQKLQQE